MVLKTYNLPGDRFFPESIGYESVTGRFFVGSLENGWVVQGDTRTGMVSTYLEPGKDGLTSAAGIKIDSQRGLLYIAGGSSGKIFIYELESAVLVASFQVSAASTVINDFVILPEGVVYVTDSLNPYVYKVVRDNQNHFQLDKKWLDLTATPIEYQVGLNLNGITVSPDHKYLLVGQTNTGQLYRINLATKEVQRVDLGGENLLHADGIFLENQTLYVALNAVNTIGVIQMSQDLLKGKIVARITDPVFRFPTAIARYPAGLLVVNGQLDKEGAGGAPELPFTVSEISLPDFSA